MSRMLTKGKGDGGGRGLRDRGWSGRPSLTRGFGVAKVGTRPVCLSCSVNNTSKQPL